VGRPSKYKKKYCEDVVKHMEQGYSFESFAANIDVNQDTVHEWARRHKEFSEAKKIGFAKCLKFWERIAIASSLGKIENFNATSFIFNMKNRFRWTDRTDLNIQNNIDADSEDHKLLKSVPRKELLKIVRR